MVGVVENGPSRQNTEVTERAQRRRFSAEYKRKILTEAEACKKDPGKIGALLRREGLYSSHLAGWRKQLKAGGVAALAGKKRGPKTAAQSDPRVAELERENKKLRKRAERAEALVALQKKVSEVLGIELATSDDEEMR